MGHTMNMQASSDSKPNGVYAVCKNTKEPVSHQIRSFFGAIAYDIYSVGPLSPFSWEMSVTRFIVEYFIRVSNGGILSKYEFGLIVFALLLLISVCVRCYVTAGKDDFSLHGEDIKISQVPDESELDPKTLSILNDFRSLDKRLDEFEKEIERLEEMRAKAMQSKAEQESTPPKEVASAEEITEAVVEEEPLEDLISISESKYAQPYLRFRKNLFE